RPASYVASKLAFLLKFNLIRSETVPTTKRPATRWHAVAARERRRVINVFNVINAPAASINHVNHVNHVPPGPNEGANGDINHVNHVPPGPAREATGHCSYETVDWRASDDEQAF